MSALLYLAGNPFQSLVGANFGFSQKTSSNHIHRVVKALNRPEIMGQFIRMPQRTEVDDSKLTFFQRTGMAGMLNK